MSGYEYKVVPAPTRGEKAKGVKGNEARFALAIERLMNDMAESGWDYQRAETLPSEERSGLTASVTVWRTMLVFRRARADETEALQPRLLEAPDRTAPLRPAAGPTAATASGDAPMVPHASGEATTATTPTDGDVATDIETASGSADTPDAARDDRPAEEISTPRPGPAPDKPASENSSDNGVEPSDDRDLSAILRARAGRSDEP